MGVRQCTVENLVTMHRSPIDSFINQRVLVTGHTGFKGSWLCEWLLALGAEVHGLALEPTTSPSLFDQLRLGPRLASHTLGDIRDRTLVQDVVSRVQPRFILHLAAQPLVRLSYSEPIETFDINVLGTAHLLDAARMLKSPCAIVSVTTDKCYENKEWLYGYREEDPLGGHDPYSASKACAEIVTAAYRRSFFGSGLPVAVASARAGNVIGGGDWALDRIVPDCMRALKEGTSIRVRNAAATRPWQHVLEPLGGYLVLASQMARAQDASDRVRLAQLCSPFNFGPTLASNRSVRDLVEEVLRSWPGTWKDFTEPNAPHEAGRLMLAIDRAHHVLGWQPVWDFEKSVARTVEWYRAVAQDETKVDQLTRRQIDTYMRDAGMEFRT